MSRSLESPAKKTRKPRKSVQKAARLLESGEAVTVASAARILGVSQSTLNRQFERKEVHAYLVRKATALMLAGVVRAARVKLELMETGPDKVRSAIATEILAIAGIKAKAETQDVNVTVSPGYVVRLDEPTPLQIVEAKAEPVEPSSPSDDEETEHLSPTDRLIRDLG